MTDDKRVSLQELAGIWLREHRDISGLRQDDIAAAAQRMGFNWARSSVGQLENGTRHLAAEELLALPLILADAIATLPGRDAAAVGLRELLKPPRGFRVELAPGLSLRGKQVEDLWDKAWKTGASEGVVTEAERRAADRLGVDVETLTAASYALWGRPLDDERDRRLAHDAGEGSDRALRGHITRLLDVELTEYFETEGR